jgi:ATP-dependent RNA helicase DeaD
MSNFTQFGLSDRMLSALNNMGFTTPTPIQEKAIPLALSGRDILGSAQTGTGKTGAFAIPLIEHILKNDDANALILTPTRELAKQVMDVIHSMTGRKSVNTAFIIGGEPYPKQLNQLRNNPRIIVGTPGRINDHIERKTLKLDRTSFLVLDETDRMLDMGFGVQLDRIALHLPKQRQTLLFSATMPDAIVGISKKYLTNPERIAMGATNIVAPKIEQEIITLKQDEKYGTLLDQLNERDGSVIIFMKTKYSTEKLAKSLEKDGHSADAMHGDLRQSKRTRVLNNFRNKKFRILVATDIAARGLDVPHIEHVVNFDLPQLAEDYIHRMGRTARAGADGSALVLISPADRNKWREIERLLGIASNDSGRKQGGGRNRSNAGGGGRGKPFAKKSNGGGFGKKPWEKSERNGDDTRGKKFGGKKPYQKRDGDNNTSNGDNGGYKKKSYAGANTNGGEKKPWVKSDRPANNEGRPARNGKPFVKRDNDDRPARNGDKPAYAKKASNGAGKKPWHKSDKPKSSDSRPDRGTNPFVKKSGGKTNDRGSKPFQKRAS